MRDVKLIVWEKVSMVTQIFVETWLIFASFGGKVIIFEGDFRLTLSVVQNGRKNAWWNFKNMMTNSANMHDNVKLSLSNNANMHDI